MKNHKEMSYKKANFYFSVIDYCPIKFIKKYAEKKMQKEMSDTISRANKLIRDSIWKNE